METIKIGLYGFGVVGQGIYHVIGKAKNAHAEIVKICVKNLDKPRDIEVPEGLLTDNVDEILNNDDIDLIVEVINDADAAYEIVRRALEKGIPVVSGSKAMVAAHLPELIRL